MRVVIRVRDKKMCLYKKDNTFKETLRWEVGFIRKK